MPTAPPPLLGRAPLLAAIDRAARGGRGAVLTGPSGSGGTRLLTEALSASRRAGLRAARLVPDPDGGRATFLPPLERSAIGVLPDEDRSTVRAAALAIGLDAVFLDEPHLLDEEAGALLVDLARSGTAVVANATGPKEAPDPIRVLIEEGLAVALPIDPLTPDEVERLAGDLLGDPVDADLAVALAAACGGRPGILSEVVDDGVGSRSIVHADGLWRLVAPLPAPRAVRAAVLAAFSGLSPEQRGWIAAVAHAGLLADDLARRIAAAETIDAADEAGWTLRDSSSAATRIAAQPIAAAVLGSLDPRARAAVLRRLVAATESSDRPLGDVERAAVLRWRIEIGLPVDASEALRVARLPSLEPAVREALLRAALAGGALAAADLADHLRRTRRPAAALELVGSALPTAEGDERIALLRVQAMTTGVDERDPVRALRGLEAHLVEPDPHADLVAVRAGMLLMAGRPAEAAASAARAVATADRSGFADAFGLLQVALAHRELGDLDMAAAAAERLLALDRAEERFPDAAAIARWLPLDLAVAVAADPDRLERDLVAAREALPAGSRSARRPPLSFTLATIHLLRADPATAVRLLREADAGDGAWRDGWQPKVLAELVIAQTLSGALEDAGATRERLSRLTCPPVHRGRVDLAAAQVAMATGDVDRAQALARAVADRGSSSGLALDAFDGAFAGIRYGDPAAPERLLALGPRPAGPGRDAQRGYATALLADDAAAVDRASIALWDAGLRLHGIEAATRGAGLGSADAGRRAVAWLARTPSLRRPWTGDRRTNALTAREREVALLAAHGASDRAIAAELDITLRTAQTHLSRALGKLGVHRRTELRGLMVEP